MKDCDRLRQAKSEMKKRLEYEIVMMKKHCKLNEISNATIAKNCGLPTSQVWRFLNRTSPEMTMVNFLLVAKGIGYDFKFTLPGQQP
jgi:hypothetical protein